MRSRDSRVTSAALPPAVSEAPSHPSANTWAPRWITVKYRATPVDVAAPYFTHAYGGGDGISDAWYDKANQYLLIGINGTFYHYCRVPEGVWASVSGMSMSSYRSLLKGSCDCRLGGVPSY